MNRRSFLKALLAVPFAGVAAKKLLEETPAINTLHGEDYFAAMESFLTAGISDTTYFLPEEALNQLLDQLKDPLKNSLLAQIDLI